MILENSYPINGYQVAINNFENWRSFMAAGFYDIANDNHGQRSTAQHHEQHGYDTRHWFGTPADFTIALNMKAIAEGLHKEYDHTKVGQHYIGDYTAMLCDVLSDLTHVLGLLYTDE